MRVHSGNCMLVALRQCWSLRTDRSLGAVYHQLPLSGFLRHEGREAPRVGADTETIEVATEKCKGALIGPG